MRKNNDKEPPRKIAVIDAETDPFNGTLEIAPFCWGFFDGENYVQFWGENSTKELVEFIIDSEFDGIIYAHNGGKFDFHFIFEYISNPLRFIGSRLVSAKIGKAELRDSYAIMPVSLAKLTGQKLEIDYQKMTKKNREKNKAEILVYLKQDCVALHGACVKFLDKFGLKLTIGQTALGICKEFHPFIPATFEQDTKYRQFFYGGRCQAFETGKINGNFQIFDVNSMYPAVMRNFEHPTDRGYICIENGKLDKYGFLVGMGSYKNQPYFAIIEAENQGCLPARTKDGLTFSQKDGVFFACHHEIKAGLKAGRLRIKSVKELFICQNTINFAEFVDYAIGEKIAAEKAGDLTGRELAKLVANSCYGKFAQDSRNFTETVLTKSDDDVCLYIGEYAEKGISFLGEFQPVNTYKNMVVWEKEIFDGENGDNLKFNDVSIGASITSAARSILFNALLNSKRPIYCDTDSIICEEFNGEIDPLKLGAWKFEGEIEKECWIAGKKLYAMPLASGKWKTASKGAHLSPDEIVRIAEGGHVVWNNPAPSFSFFNEPRLVNRKIQSTNSDKVFSF